ncbi:hypothetical protein EDB89DRAFT_409001 [Lactarius sanguifluus]|nr:hypothetical protein EDB89DRAFT_409001 [Lactarius sanguifluus]
MVRRINSDVPSVPGSRAVTIKFMIPNSHMGSVIGKQGSKIKETKTTAVAYWSPKGMIYGYEGYLLYLYRSVHLLPCFGLRNEIRFQYQYRCQVYETCCKSTLLSRIQ